MMNLVSKEGLGLAKILELKMRLQVITNLEVGLTSCSRHQEVVDVQHNVRVELAVVEQTEVRME